MRLKDHFYVKTTLSTTGTKEPVGGINVVDTEPPCTDHMYQNRGETIRGTRDLRFEVEQIQNKLASTELVCGLRLELVA
jgi:hypothetical protein